MTSLLQIQISEVGFQNPVFLLIVPLAIVILLYIFFIRKTGVEASRKKRTILFSSRVIIAVLLTLVAAQPYTVQTQTTSGEQRVQMLIDSSDSMQVHSNITQNLAGGIEENGVPVEMINIGSNEESRIGDSIVSNLEQGGDILLFSDGYNTGGRSLSEAADIARSVNARINAVNISVVGTEKYISIGGPSKTSRGVETKFRIQLGGVNIGQSASRINIDIDGQQVTSRTLNEPGQFEITHTFETTGEHRITATVTGGDRFERNNVFYKTIRVVEQPEVLYVSNQERPFFDILNDLYNVKTASEVPSDLSRYYAVVLQDIPADNIGDIEALQEFVIDGNGLVVAGGPNSYDNGGYGSSIISDMLPVRIGESNRVSDIVLVIDISGSTQRQMTVQKSLALDAIDQMGDENRVGVVAFNHKTYRVSNIQRLGGNRAQIKESIRRLQNNGATVISGGLMGAEEMLGNSGNIILITDGIANDAQKAIDTARRLGVKGINIITVGVGSRTNVDYMRRLAEVAQGNYFAADQTNRLRIFFGGEDKKPEGSGLTIVDNQHFITSGVDIKSNPPKSNKVTVKNSGNLLVASGSGTSTVAAGRYGLGRVVSITSYGQDGTLDGLLSSPDSLLLSRSVNWAIGNPERKELGGVDIDDTRINQPTQVIYRGKSRPSFGGLTFSRSGEQEYTATVTPTEQGYETLRNAEYGVNYPLEYAGFGFSNSLRSTVEATGGEIYESNQAQQIASEIQTRATSPKQVQQEWGWLALILALILYLIEILVRRIQEIYGYTLSQRLPNWVPYNR